jgi:hypothetical protein
VRSRQISFAEGAVARAAWLLIVLQTLELKVADAEGIPRPLKLLKEQCERESLPQRKS